MGIGAGLYMYVVVVQKFTFAISSPDEFLFTYFTPHEPIIVFIREWLHEEKRTRINIALPLLT